MGLIDCFLEGVKSSIAGWRHDMSALYGYIGMDFCDWAYSIGELVGVVAPVIFIIMCVIGVMYIIEFLFDVNIVFGGRHGN